MTEGVKAKEKVQPDFYGVKAYCALPRASSAWLIQDFLPMGFTSLFASPKTGKSLLMLACIEAIVNGEKEWCGKAVLDHGNCMYLQVDTPRNIWAPNVEKFILKDDAQFDLYTADMWTTPSGGFNIMQMPKDAIAFTEDKDGNDLPITDPEWLSKKIDQLKPKLLVIDTFREIHNFDEDKSGAMKMVLQALQKALGEGVACVLVGHKKKDSDRTTNSEDDLMDSGRGSTYIPGKMDLIMRQTKKKIQLKGRAIGYTEYSWEWDDRPYPRLCADNEEKKGDIYATITKLSDDNPGITKAALAGKIKTLLKISERTAYRRIDEWQQQQEARQKAQQRLANNPMGQELIVDSKGTRIDLATGEELPPEQKSGLWNEPIQW